MKILFVALSVALGWGLRGEIGGEQGALIPGVLLGLSLALSSGKESWIKNIAIIGSASAFGMSLGGIQSYGLLIGYTMCRDMLNVTYGYLMLAIVGGLWGAFAGGILGMVLPGEKLRIRFWVPLIIILYIGGELCYYILIELIGIRMTPPRAENWAWVLGAILALLAVNIYLKDTRTVRLVLKGFLAGGIGFMFGESLQVYGRFLGPEFDWWKVMEISFGFVMGGGLAIAIFTEFEGEEKQWEVSSATHILAILVVTAFVPLVTLYNMLEGFEEKQILLRTTLWQDPYFNILLRGVALAILSLLILFATEKRKGLIGKLDIHNLGIFLFIWSVWSNGWITQMKMALPQQGTTSVIIHYIFLLIMILLSVWSVWKIPALTSGQLTETQACTVCPIRKGLTNTAVVLLLILIIIPLLALLFAGTSILTHSGVMPPNIRPRF